MDRWLVELKSQKSLCLDEWWVEKGLDKRHFLKKNLPVENWIVLEVPRNYSNSLKELPCVHSVIIDQLLENRSKIPNDPDFTNQVDMNLIGMPDAWDISTGGLTPRGDTIVVAVIDNGFQLNHEDLERNLWHNNNEIPQDGIDNDSNGYIDDYLGWDITSDTDNHPVQHHGTCVSGIIGAKGNNGKGICGINWNVKIMMISYDFHISELIEAYKYVVDMRRKYNQTHGKYGAFVVAVNLSAGLDYAFPENFPLWCSMYDSLGAEGVLGVCSVANNSHSVDQDGDLPARCTSSFTIIVTNVSSEDEIMGNAGYGRISVDLGAPGEQTLTTDTSNTYNYFTGTSAAAPHVAGTVALLYSVACPVFFDSLDTNPGDVAIRIKNIILSSGTPNKSLEGITLSGRRLQTDAALRMLLNECDGEIQPKVQIRFIAPNPTGAGSAKLFFESIGEISDIYLELYSINGVKLSSSKISTEEYHQGFIEINTKSLPFGLYIAALRYGDQSVTGKLVVR